MRQKHFSGMLMDEYLKAKPTETVGEELDKRKTNT